MSNRERAKRQAERRAQNEQDFINAVEFMYGFKLPPWQKEVLLHIRDASISGKPISFTTPDGRKYGDAK